MKDKTNEFIKNVIGNYTKVCAAQANASKEHVESVKNETTSSGINCKDQEKFRQEHNPNNGKNYR